MPPVAATDHSALGWKAFFATLALLQVIAIGVMWRTYDAVSTTAEKTIIHDYQINSEIKPAIRELQNKTR